MQRIALQRYLPALALSVCFSMAAQGAVNWGYKGNIGPEHWGQLDPSYALCATGKEQAPINIPKKTASAPYALTIQNQSAVVNHIDVTIIGHLVQLDYPADPAVQSMTYAGHAYRLQQFHFHSPSETLWHGQDYPLEIHFVHQDEQGKLAVIGVFVQAGNANPALQEIINQMPPDNGKEHEFNSTRLNLAMLLPAQKDYYSFVGSLTTPPCVEDVQWIMLAATITASPAQILRIRKAGDGSNARPVQPLNHRIVAYSKAK